VELCFGAKLATGGIYQGPGNPSLCISRGKLWGKATADRGAAGASPLWQVLLRVILKKTQIKTTESFTGSLAGMAVASIFWHYWSLLITQDNSTQRRFPLQIKDPGRASYWSKSQSSLLKGSVFRFDALWRHVGGYCLALGSIKG